MFILIQTELGSKRIINTSDIDYIESLSKNISVIFLKNHPDFPIRTKLDIDDMIKVVNGEVKFFDIFKEVVEIVSGVPGLTKQDYSNSLTEAGLLKNEPAKPEEIVQVQKEFSAGLVSGKMGGSVSVKQEVYKTPEGIPTFSKKFKKQQEVIVKEKKESVW